MFKVELTPELPDNICKACNEGLDATILFLKLCKESAKRWQKITEQLEKVEAAHTVKTLYIVLEDDKAKLISETVIPVIKPITARDVYLNFRKRLNQIQANKKRSERRHMPANRFDIKLNCPECNVAICAEKKYNDHIKHFKLRWCRYCNTLVQIQEFKCHLKSHNIQTYQCNLCWEIFSTKELLAKHLKRKHQNGNHICVECKQSFISASILATHFGHFHEGRVCSGCDKKFTRYACYRFHTKTCFKTKSAEFKYICDYCSKRHKTKNGVMNHINLTHMYGWKFQCQYCGKKFPNASRLKEHDNTHNKVLDRYVCEYCDAKISTRRGYQRHVERHLIREGKLPPRPKPGPRNNKKHHCHLCTVFYNSRRDLNRHYKRKHHLIMYSPYRTPSIATL